MEAHGPSTLAERERIARIAQELGIDTVRVGGVDVDGIWRGKRIGMDEFASRGWRDGFHFCNAVFGIDVADEVIAGLGYTSWDTGFPDVHLIPDLATFAPVAWAEGTASVLGDFVEADGTPTAVSPRQVLREVLARVRAHGLEPMIGYELEFYLFAETPESARGKDYAGLTPLFPGTRTYSLVELARAEGIVGDIVGQLGASGIPVQAAGTEYSAGQFELNLQATDALTAADQVIRFKAGVREIAEAHGMLATFMAKPDAELSGSSGHVHQSLWDAERNNAFAGGAEGLSTLGTHYLAGLLATLGDLKAVYCPTVNSYKRTRPWSFVPTTATWGLDNRTVGLRVLGGSPAAARIEHRLPGADANPYLVIAACLAAGLHGIEQELEPPPPVAGNAYELTPNQATRLPETLDEAVDLLDRSKPARTLLGEAFVEHFVTTRRHEVATARAAVTDWERRRYFDVI